MGNCWGDQIEQFFFQRGGVEPGSQARGEAMSAAAELLADALDVDRAARTHAGPGQAVGQRLEEEGDLDGFDGLQIFDQAFGLVGNRAAAGVHLGREAEPGHAIPAGEVDGLEDFADEEEALGAEALVAGLGQMGRIGAGGDEAGGDFEGVGRGLAVTEVAGVGHDADVKIRRDVGRERPLQRGDDFRRGPAPWRAIPRRSGSTARNRDC